MSNGGKREGAGRPKGTKNKITKDLKQLVLNTIDELAKDGKTLATEAADDPKWFFANFVKPMLPKDVTLSGDDDAPLVFKIERVIIDNPTDTDS